MDVPKRMRPRARVCLHREITQDIARAIANGVGVYQLPWRRGSMPMQRPVSIGTGRPFHGVNVIRLWSAAANMGFQSDRWGTAAQWRAVGASPLAGEGPIAGVIYRTVPPQDDRQGLCRPRLFAKAFWLFNEEQTEGATGIGSEARPKRTPPGLVSALLRMTRAEIIIGGDRAYYSRARDCIHVPHIARFPNRPEAAEAYTSVLLHELVHWTSAPHRLNRALPGRFGDGAYAMEELIAELGCAYLCADLGICSAPRQDHARYVAAWLQVLRHDSRTLFRAAAEAEKAVTFLTRLFCTKLWSQAIIGD